MDLSNPIGITLVHALKPTAGDFLIMKLQVCMPQSFVESIGGEESPATSDYIMLLA